MTYEEQIDAAAGEMRITKRATRKIIEAFLANIQREVSAGRRVAIPQFGAFSPRQSKARRIRNPATGELMRLPAMKRAGFKPSKNWRVA